MSNQNQVKELIEKLLKVYKAPNGWSDIRVFTSFNGKKIGNMEKFVENIQPRNKCNYFKNGWRLIDNIDNYIFITHTTWYPYDDRDDEVLNFVITISKDGYILGGKINYFALGIHDFKIDGYDYLIEYLKEMINRKEEKLDYIK